MGTYQIPGPKLVRSAFCLFRALPLMRAWLRSIQGCIVRGCGFSRCQIVPVFEKSLQYPIFWRGSSFSKYDFQFPIPDFRNMSSNFRFSGGYQALYTLSSSTMLLSCNVGSLRRVRILRTRRDLNDHFVGGMGFRDRKSNRILFWRVKEKGRRV